MEYYMELGVWRILAFLFGMLRQKYKFLPSLWGTRREDRVPIASGRHSSVLLEKWLKMKQIPQKAEQKGVFTKSSSYGDQPPYLWTSSPLGLINPPCCLCFLDACVHVHTHPHIPQTTATLKKKAEGHESKPAKGTNHEKNLTMTKDKN